MSEKIEDTKSAVPISHKSAVPTPHNEAKVGDIAKTVLMPGDPLRAKRIAEEYLENVKCFNTVRNMLGFTGTYDGVEVSVMGSGMGIPSISIYATELFKFYGVENIIRIGSAGSIDKDLKVGSLILAQAASTESNVLNLYSRVGFSYCPTASFDLLEEAVKFLREKTISHKVGSLVSSDLFYGEDPDSITMYQKLGCSALDMEAAALYAIAEIENKKALTICTISDSLVTGESLDAKARETNFKDMADVALHLAVAEAKK